MGSCTECGKFTDRRVGNLLLCADCEKRIVISTLTLRELNAILSAAGEAYRQAVKDRREAYNLRETLGQDNAHANAEVRRAVQQVELAAERYRNALHDFAAKLARRNE